MLASQFWQIMVEIILRNSLVKKNWDQAKSDMKMAPNKQELMLTLTETGHFIMLSFQLIQTRNIQTQEVMMQGMQMDMDKTRKQTLIRVRVNIDQILQHTF